MSRAGDAKGVSHVFAAAADRAACRGALAELGVPVTEVATPLEACRLAAETADGGALAIEGFGVRAGLVVVRRGMRDGGPGRTRFAVVGARPSPRTGSDVTSFAFSLPKGPGGVLGVLRVLEERGIEANKIHALPADGAEGWGYLFYVESPGHFTDRPLVMAFEEMKRSARFFKVLGSYPAAPR